MIGIAYPTLSASLRTLFWLLIPIISLFLLIKGPPELPGLIGASVCINPPSNPFIEPVVVFIDCELNGYPFARTKSSDFILYESPNFNVFITTLFFFNFALNSFISFICNNAKSKLGKVDISIAENLF